MHERPRPTRTNVLVHKQGVAQSEERAVWSREVAGSRPATLTSATPEGALVAEAAAAVWRVDAYTQVDVPAWLRCIAKDIEARATAH